MEINEQKKGNASILEISGRLDTTNYTVLEKKILDLLGGGEKNLLIDFQNLDYVSSSGLRVLLMTLKKVTAAGGKLVLCNLQENIKEIFDIAGFSSIFEIYDSQDLAMQQF